MNNNFQVYTSRNCVGMNFETFKQCEEFILSERLVIKDQEISYDDDSGEPVCGYLDCRYN